jgi:hypothetical protein
MLFNTGGWRRPCRYAHPQANLASVDAETIPHVTFFEGDECEGRPFESWCETLGLDHRADVFGRIDAAHGSIGTPKLLVDEAGYLRNH